MAIYLDESGFTGNDMLNREQPVFSYASVNMEDAVAAELLQRLITKHRIKMPEIKGQRLLGSAAGRDFVRDMLGEVEMSAKAALHIKTYSLAGTFCDYVFHPIFDQTTVDVLYGIGFQKFIAFEVWAYSESESRDLLKQFIQLMRGRKPESMNFLTGHIRSRSPWLLLIVEFASIHRNRILRNMAAEGVSSYGWVEASLSCLILLLSQWTAEVGPLEIVCDKSLPLEQAEEKYNDFFYRMTEDQRNRSGMYKSLCFDLKCPIQFVDSKLHAGIQVADVVAAALTYAFKHPDKRWEDLLRPVVVNNVYPDTLSFGHQTPKRASMEMILQEMIRRSRLGADMNDGLVDYVRKAMLAPHL